MAEQVSEKRLTATVTDWTPDKDGDVRVEIKGWSVWLPPDEARALCEQVNGPDLPKGAWAAILMRGEDVRRLPDDEWEYGRMGYAEGAWIDAPNALAFDGVTYKVRPRPRPSTTSEQMTAREAAALLLTPDHGVVAVTNESRGTRLPTGVEAGPHYVRFLPDGDGPTLTTSLDSIVTVERTAR